MALTKKHLDALAEALKDCAHPVQGIHEMYCRSVADVCARFNHGFDRGRFLRACGVEAPAHTKACTAANDRSATEICICGD
jgi:hypothetical protein